MRNFAFALFASTVLTGAFAQTAIHSLVPPTLGFVVDRAGTELIPVIGIPGAARMGAALPATGATQLFVAPKGQYLLADSPSGVSMGQLRPTGALDDGLVLQPLAGVAAADVVAFSPSGTAAALYSKSANTIQVLTGMPRATRVDRTFVVSATYLQRLAVADDGQELLGQDGAGALVSWTAGAVERTLPYQPKGGMFLAFAPRTHEAFGSDTAADTLVRIAEGSVSVLASSEAGLHQPADLAVTGDGGAVLIASGSKDTIYVVDRVAGKVTAYRTEGPIKQLRALAAADTYLISYADGGYGVLGWRNNRASLSFVGVARNGAQ